MGNWLRELRSRVGLSQFEVADRLGVHWVTVSRWENGRGEPRLVYLRELARMYLAHALAVKDSCMTGHCSPPEGCGHGLVYDGPGMAEVVARYVARGVGLGYKIVVFHGRAESPEEVAVRLACEAWNAKSAVEDGQLALLPTEEAFLTGGQFDLGWLISEAKRLAEQSTRAGFAHVRWVVDLRPLAELGDYTCELIAYEYVADSVSRTQARSHWICVYPSPDEDLAFQACLLCRHPWVVTPRGVVRNPYYQDSVLCRARTLAA
ncbi:MAG: MEDS domain-containing protein [Candidatus Bipolaricaulaceae bacterium]